MRYILKIFLILIFLTACTTPQKQVVIPQPEPSIEHLIQKTYVETVELDRTHPVANEMKLIVRGQLPSPAYVFDVVDVVKDDHKIYLTPFAVFEEKTTALQVLIPYETSVIVRIDSPGEYNLILIGRGITLRKNVFVD